MQEKTRSQTASAFQWDDPFLLEGQLSEDERMPIQALPGKILGPIGRQ